MQLGQFGLALLLAAEVEQHNSLNCMKARADSLDKYD